LTLRRFLSAIFSDERPGKRVQIGERQVVVEGLPRNFWTDLHHYAMTARWPIFFAALAIAFTTVNLVFAGLYTLAAYFGDDPVANAPPGSFLDYFFFSVETVATVGYGDMHPQSLIGHAIATLATFVGLSSVAITAGLTFARFAQPRARLLFAHNPVIGAHDGARTLMLRFANERHNAITAASARMWLIRNERTMEGATFRKFHALKLTRDENPIFAFTWTLMHVIAEDSPLHGWAVADFDDPSASLIVIFDGHDETSAQSVRGRRIYSARDILLDHEYVDIVETDETGSATFDYKKFHDTRPAATPRDDKGGF
jgi:inward rectifier potassium channel